MRHLFLLLSIFSVGFSTLSAQECEFDVYSRKGGQYYFSTFYTDGSLTTPRQDTCYREVNGHPYELRVFKDGIIREEKLYNQETGDVYADFKRVTKDSVIAEYSYFDEKKHLTLQQIYYYDKQKHRCWKEVSYAGENIHSIRLFRSIHSSELAAAGYEARPDRVVDAEGYTDISSQFGEELTYHVNGKLARRQMYTFTVTSVFGSSESETGTFEEYNEQGKLTRKGALMNGQPDGTHIYYYPNGQIAGEMYYSSGEAIGTWKSYFENGKLQSKTEYDAEKYEQRTGHEIRYYANGTVAYEREILMYSTGFENTYYENGALKERVRYEHGLSERTEFRAYYQNGQLRQKTYYRPRNDTSSAEFFENGNLMRVSTIKKDNYDMREYFANGKLKNEQRVERNGDNLKQVVAVYYENGTPQTRSETKNDVRIETAYWPNGILKTEKDYNKNLLNGTWKEQDSTGHVTKDCRYKDGYRTDKAGVFEFPVLPKLTATEQKGIRNTVNQYYACTFFSAEKEERTRSAQQLDQEAAALGRLYSYCKLSGKEWRLDTVTGPNQFQYLVNIPEGQYRSHQKSIDSIFSARQWKVNLTISYGYASGTFTSALYYNNAYFDNVFVKYFVPNSGIISMQTSCPSGGDMESGYYNVNPTAHMVRVDGAWKIELRVDRTVSAYVVYDSGEVELYNGMEAVTYGSPIMLSGKSNPPTAPYIWKSEENPH